MVWTIMRTSSNITGQTPVPVPVAEQTGRLDRTANEAAPSGVGVEQAGGPT